VDLLIILVASLLLILLVIFTSGLARIVLGILFVLLFPGYTLIAVLFPRKTDLDSLTRLALSLGISLALVVIILLILNFTPWGIRLYPILISLFLFTGSMAGIAWFRRRRLHPEERFAPAYRINMSKLSRYWANQSKMDKILTGLLVARPNVSEKFTEFYILGPQGKAQDYPSELALGEEGVVIVGIVNNEREAMTYSLGITINGEKVNEISVIRLEQGEKWEQPVTFTPAKVGLDQKVEFLLYKQTPEPYRTLYLWIDVTE
jgi:uncharacterized membrane protein